MQANWSVMDIINGLKDGGKVKVKLIELSQKDMIIFLREKEPLR